MSPRQRLALLAGCALVGALEAPRAWSVLSSDLRRAARAPGQVLAQDEPLAPPAARLGGARLASALVAGASLVGTSLAGAPLVATPARDALARSAAAGAARGPRPAARAPRAAR